jgi:hypothetical protein
VGGELFERAGVDGPEQEMRVRKLLGRPNFVSQKRIGILRFEMADSAAPNAKVGFNGKVIDVSSLKMSSNLPVSRHTLLSARSVDPDESTTPGAL